MVKKGLFPNRSEAIQDAVERHLKDADRSKLARECAKLDPGFEKSLAEEGLSTEVSAWPEY